MGIQVAYISDRHVGMSMNNLNEGMIGNFDPLLVQLHDNLNHYKSDKHDTQTQSDLMQTIAELMDAKLSEIEKNMAADVMISLIKQAEQNIRHSLSEKLAPRDDLHPGLLHFLAYDDIDVAEHVLVHSPLLSDMDLQYVIHAKSGDHWQAIAKRNALSEKIISTLVDKQHDLTTVNLLQNEKIEISTLSLEKIIEQAMISPSVAETIAEYKSLPRDLAVNIYWHVSNSIRHKITKTFDINKHEIDVALQDCVQDFSDTLLQDKNVRPSNLMIEAAEKYHSNDKITDDLLVGTLRRRQGRFFIALFCKKTNLSTAIVWNMMRQIGGQGLAVACRAMNITKENFVSIFLLSRSITRSSQSVTAEELRMAMRYYDGLTHKMAKEILKDSIAN